MIRKLNSTGRRRIEREAIRLRVINDAGRTTVLSVDYELPPEMIESQTARVFLDLKAGTYFRRVELSSIGAGAPQRVPLAGLEDIDGVRGFLRVVEAGSGKILGEARNLRPVGRDEAEAERESLLQIRRSKLDGLIWKLQLEGEDQPVLLIEESLGSLTFVVGNPAFQALVLPEVLRRILEEVNKEGWESDSDDQDDWKVQWRRLGIRYGNWPGSLTPDGLEDWKENVAGRFAREFEVVRKFQTVIDNPS